MPFILNCFLLFIPVLIWNSIFYRRLPEPYQKRIWNNVPKIIIVIENIFRALAFILPFFLTLSPRSCIQYTGVIVYAIGVIAYFTSWFMQIYYKTNRWSQSVWGFTAPAFTSLIWLSGVGLIGQELVFDIPYNFTVFMLIALLFAVIHTVHAYMVYKTVYTSPG